MQDGEIRTMVSSRITQKSVFLRNIMDRMTRELPPVEKRINLDVLNRMIASRLQERGIDLEYEMAVKKPDNRVLYHTPAYGEETRSGCSSKPFSPTISRVYRPSSAFISRAKKGSFTALSVSCALPVFCSYSLPFSCLPLPCWLFSGRKNI